MAWYDRGGEPVAVLAELWADVEYGLAMAVERGGVSLSDAARGRVVWQWRRHADGDCYRYVTIRESGGGYTVDASWLWLCGADSYTADTPAEAREAAEQRARQLMDSLPGRWEETIADGRTPVSAGAVVRPEGQAGGVAGNPPRRVPPRPRLDDAGELPQRAPAVR